jgi:hypothetical protein
MMAGTKMCVLLRLLTAAEKVFANATTVKRGARSAVRYTLMTIPVALYISKLLLLSVVSHGPVRNVQVQK